MTVTRAWTNATLQNGWVVYDPSDVQNSWAIPAFRKDALGMVHLRGLAKQGTTTGGTTLFTLPEGCRPGRDYLFAVLSNDGVATTAVARVDVYPSGAVVLLIGGNGWLSFNGISFLAEA